MIVLATAMAMAGAPAKGDGVQFRTVTLAETKLEIGVLEPSADGPFRTILSLPPGPQNREMVQAGFSPWARELAAEGWLVVSPVAPGGQLFFQGAEVHLPALLDTIEATWPVDGKLYLLGVSNGGRSAFKLAAKHPDRFRSMTVIPGVPDDDDALARLKGIAVTVVVGGEDGAWTVGSRKAHEALVAAGVDSKLVVLEGKDHFAFHTVPFKRLKGWLERGG